MADEKGPSIALASPLGGTGYAMTCFCVGMSFTGVFPVDGGWAMALPMAVLFAGFSQYVVGILEFIRGNHALGYCHGTYGIWGMGTGIMLFLQITGILPAASPAAMAVYWGGWALITLVITITVVPTSTWFAGVLGLLLVVFVCFAISGFVPVFGVIGAWLTVLDGLAALYVCAAFSLNTSFGRKVLPVG